MGLLLFRAGGGRRRGARREEGEELIELPDPADILELIDSGEDGLARVRSAAARGKGRSHRLGDVQLLAPLDAPRGNVIAIGRNYQKHAEETAVMEGREPSPPTIFTKAITSLTEPYAEIAIDPQISDKIDWEVELAVVIGRRGANIRREDARPYVFGYTVLNDVTARDIQSSWGGQYFKGKSLDRSCPTGPWIVTSDELKDPQSLGVRLRLDGKMEQDGNTGGMSYPVDVIIQWVAQ